MEISNTFDQIVSADKSATVFLNNDMGTAADTLFWGLSSRLIWVPVAIYFLYLIVVKRNYDWVMKAAIVLGLVITITLCDQITSSIFKPLVVRFRPSHDIEICAMLHYVNNYHGGNYGFMSSHAANAFGAAMLGAEISERGISRYSSSRSPPWCHTRGFISGCISSATWYAEQSWASR